MEAVILRSTDHAMLDRLVANFVPGKPFCDEQGVRIGSVLAVRREGDKVIAVIECVFEDIQARLDAGRFRPFIS